MADTKISALTALTTPVAADLLAIVDDPAGTPITKKVTVGDVLAILYPVGSLYISTLSTNPGTLLGFGTWAAFAAGRVLVGLDSGDTDFDTVEETGGAKTITLATAEIPAHTHTQDAHTHTQNAHNHTQASTTTATGSTSNRLGSVDTSSTAVATGNATAVNQNATAVNQNAGGGGAHANVQPYIVTYMWKRSA